MQSGTQSLILINLHVSRDVSRDVYWAKQYKRPLHSWSASVFSEWEKEF